MNSSEGFKDSLLLPRPEVSRWQELQHGADPASPDPRLGTPGLYDNQSNYQ